MMGLLADYTADSLTAITYAALLIGLVILLVATLWPLEPTAEPDPMAESYGDWPHIDRHGGGQ